MVQTVNEITVKQLEKVVIKRRLPCDKRAQAINLWRSGFTGTL